MVKRPHLLGRAALRAKPKPDKWTSFIFSILMGCMSYSALQLLQMVGYVQFTCYMCCTNVS